MSLAFVAGYSFFNVCMIMMMGPIIVIHVYIAAAVVYIDFNKFTWPLARLVPMLAVFKTYVYFTSLSSLS